MLMRDAGIDLLTTSGHHHDQASRTDANPHIWLDPVNAVLIVDRVATVLAELDPANAGRYRSNREAAITRLRALDRSLEAALAPVRGTPFMASHDAYAYLVSRYGLNMVGVFHPTPERAPGARHLSKLRNRMTRLGVRCVFSEPQFASRTVAASVRRAGARSAVLDPLGADTALGPAAYEIVMRRLAAALAGCLSER